MAYGDYQMSIYGAGLQGVLPRFPMDYATWERKAAAAMPEWVVSYVAGGAGDESTQRANVEAFTRWGTIPRMMRAATDRDLSVEFFGLELPSPLFLCPIGLIGLCSQDLHGDVAVARASARTGVPLTVSTLTQDPLEEVRKQMGATPGFFQLYTPKNRDLAASLIHRAEAAGFSALVVTADTWVTGWRPRDLSTANFPQLRGYCLSNYFSDPVFRSLLGKDPAEHIGEAVQLFASVFGQSLSWEDIDWIRETTKLPMVIKGICHPDDARTALDHGCDGLYVSNHGGRQANGGIPALDHLRRVVEVAGDSPILFDSGVRSGADVVKAVAAGATAVGIGRPYAWAAALGGADAVEHLIRSILAEADLLMAVDGFASLNQVRAAGLVPCG